jgi:hypothetical protein
LKENRPGQWHRHEDTGHPDDVAHHGHISQEAYGQRYPPNASSVEADLDREIQTNVSTHRSYLKRQQQIYGDVLPNLHADKLEELLDITKELLKSHKRANRLTRSRVEQGKCYTFPISLAATAGVNHIDFIHQEAQYQRWTSGVSVNVPGHRVKALQIFNDGPGVVAFQTNTEVNSYEATCTLTSGINKLVEFHYPVIENVNLVSTSGAVNLRLLVTY